MVNSTGATTSAAGTAPKTPPHGVNSASVFNSTPLSVGSAAVSEYISTLGVRHVNSLCLAIGIKLHHTRDEILQDVYAIASEESAVKDHIPDMVWFHKFDQTSTMKIRKSLGIQDPDAERGSRVLYITVFRKLVPITSLSGDEFLSAWWQIVLCHYTLWKHNVHHLDISPSNLMVYWWNGQWIGVLNDYDLSSIERDGPSGKERTGTVPFVAIDLLAKDAILGKVTHLYRHDAESLVWVLVWVCLRYQGGKLLRNGRLLDDWLKVDAPRCEEKKSAFIWRFRHGHADLEKPSPSHQSNWKIAVTCLRSIHNAPKAKMDEEITIT